MKNLAFAFWMVGWPLSCSVMGYIGEGLLHHVYSEGVQAAAALLQLATWLSVGWAIYEK